MILNYSLNHTKTRSKKKFETGFTLIELLTIIMIIAVVSIAALVYYGGVNKNTRDSVRVGDLTSLNQAIILITKESATQSASLYCTGTQTYPCFGSSYPESDDSRKVDGTGWIHIDFSNKKEVNMQDLPEDQINNEAFHYAYCANNNDWEINAVLEDDQKKMTDDGGDDNTKYEIGTDLGLIDKVSGCSY